uniref:Uncharacterized protein n=1 Tax=Timema bartmani TaxID=61472 RepID=A0A7R9F661_9NEOP|nr:unnamed protein product [Timema bartmani]
MAHKLSTLKCDQHNSNIVGNTSHAKRAEMAHKLSTMKCDQPNSNIVRNTSHTRRAEMDLVVDPPAGLERCFERAEGGQTVRWRRYPRRWKYSIKNPRRDSPGTFEEANASNRGFETHRSLTAKSKTVDLLGYLHGACSCHDISPSNPRKALASYLLWLQERLRTQLRMQEE